MTKLEYFLLGGLAGFCFVEPGGLFVVAGIGVVALVLGLIALTF